jgi:hypothetical protein
MRRCIPGSLCKMQKKWLISCNFQRFFCTPPFSCKAILTKKQVPLSPNYIIYIRSGCPLFKGLPKQLSAYPLWAV